MRYRLRQLDELFGARLADPDARFDMAVALRALHLGRPARAGQADQLVDDAVAS